jgi:hypothetical protein
MESRPIVLGVPTTSDRIELYLYFCEADCSKVYSPDRGYFDWVPDLLICEMIHLSTINRVRCRSCGQFMYVSEQIDPQNGAVVWRCSTQGCAYVLTREITN